MNLFPSCVSLSRVLNVHIFQVVCSRLLGAWLNRLPCRLSRLTLPKPFLLVFNCDGDKPSLSPPTSPPLPLLSLLLFFCYDPHLRDDDGYCYMYYCYSVNTFFMYIDVQMMPVPLNMQGGATSGTGGSGEVKPKKLSIKGGKAD